MAPPQDDDGLLTPEEQELLRRVERSRVWKLIRDALCMQRELLFAGASSIGGLTGQPTTTEALWCQRGAILLIQHLLQESPKFVIWYTRFMNEKREKSASSEKAADLATPPTERTYSARPDSEPPDFDL